jgi:hypothetical protein
MQKSTLESTLLYLGIACMAGSLFRQSLHLPPASEMIFAAAGIACFIGVFVVRRRRRTGDSTASAPRRSQSLALRLWSLFLILAASLSGPWWLPYMGVTLDFTHRVIVAIISCAIGVSIFLFAWWYGRKRPNQ